MKGSIFRQAVMTLAVLVCLLAGGILPADAAGVSFTQEELDYIKEARVLKAVSIDGIAPLSHVDSNGELKGIGVNLLHRISGMTGLVFEYELYETVDEALASDYDIYFNAAYIYMPADIALSQPYLKSETILYINSAIDRHQIDSGKYAAVKGGTLPAGVDPDNTIYYNNREDAVDAVEKGEADYGYGNAYSLAFYTLQNGYKNIITIPASKEKREYCLAVPPGNEVLLSILNKSITALDEDQMQTLVLDVASQVERKITLAMITHVYGKQILVIVLLAMAVLLISVFFNVRANNRLKIENRRYQLLSHISNECLFEYSVKSGKVELSEKFHRTIDIIRREKEVINRLKEVLMTWHDDKNDEHLSTVKLPLVDGNAGVFKVICSNVTDENGNLYSIIGKLVDISEEVREKETLINKSRLDGLTGLYNAAAARELVIKSIENKAANKTDAFIMIDCDNFKSINDTYGHLKGDQVLKSIGESIKKAFRQTDILGRVGGDEFCVYMHDIPEEDFVREKCRQLDNLIQGINEGFPVSISTGIAFLKEQNTYEELFNKADAALYIAKRRGGAQISIHAESDPPPEKQARGSEG